MVGRSVVCMVVVMGCAASEPQTYYVGHAPPPPLASAPPPPYGYAPPPPYGYTPPPPVMPQATIHVSTGYSGGYPSSGSATGNSGYASNERSSCKMGSDGRQACGYDCKIGSNGVAACANAPGGKCALGSNGQVYCSNVNMYRRGQKAECHLNSDGTQTCGYNCKFGRGGYFCASEPDGACGLNSDGTYTCS